MQPNDVLIVGEAPGRTEYERGQPFVGKSGQEQEAYLARHGLSTRPWRVTNLVQEYRAGNPDPTVAQVREWTPAMVREIEETNPKLVLAVGRHAARWFFDDAKVQMQNVHGVPVRSARAPGAIVLPITHPATGFYSGDARAVIAWDYERAAAILKQIRRGGVDSVQIARDGFESREMYHDLSGAEFGWCLAGGDINRIAIDTEGTPSAPWSIQVAGISGSAYMLRRSREDFEIGAQALQRVVDQGALVILHNAMWDMAVLRSMGVETRRANLFDTMYAAYLLRVEPQGLKPLARRWCGMEMEKYDAIVEGSSLDRQIAYLTEVAARDWGKPEPRIVTKNDGTSRLYKPKALAARALAMLNDYVKFLGRELDEPDGAGSEDAESATGELNLVDRWYATPDDVRRPAEAEFGRFPEPTLDDAPLDASIHYACRDADATLRLYERLVPVLASMDLTRTMDDGMGVLPVFEEMQATGMIASRAKFAALTREVEADMERLQGMISWKWFARLPFNPASSPHVATLMRRRGLVGEKTTTSGKVSTAKKSIEHLRYKDEAIAAVIDWREDAKIRDAFCRPVLDRMPRESEDARDLYPIRCKIKTTRVTTRRLAAADPNLLQIPTRHELGKKVRECYVAPEGQVYGSWDLSMIEMRVMAHESRDELMCRLITEGKDIHTETASMIFGLPLEEVDKMKHRYPAKRASFGILYGITGAGLYDQLRMMKGMGEDWSAAKCDKLIDDWLNVYSGVKRYIEWCGREAAKTGYVRDHYGMYRYIPGIWSRDLKASSEAARIAVSHRIQGMAQGMIQRSMIYLRDEIRALQDAGLNVRWCLQIHDELILRLDRDLWELVDEIVVEGLTKHAGVELRVPIEAGGSFATSWGEIEK